MAGGEKSIEEELSLPILFAKRAIKYAKEVESFKPQNNNLAIHVAKLSQHLRVVACLTTLRHHLRLRHSSSHSRSDNIFFTVILPFLTSVDIKRLISTATFCP
ncbi:Uncharacterized protein Adt_02079 [Abeliophyllum distichum]|uniref:DUF7792 domain-containing protein n=1 Tax=Abeliophyllum distichum TaxID=126358 RepID=A0ABD1VV49_9LAMI